METDFLYLDYAATAPVSSDLTYSLYEANKLYGNPASYHKQGEIAYQALQAAKLTMLTDLGHDNTWDIIYTSGATEATNTIFEAFQPDLVITTDIEHKATINSIKRLEKCGTKVIKLEISKWSNWINKDYIISLLAAEGVDITKINKILISIIGVNNETGDVISENIIADIKNILQTQSGIIDATVITHLDFTQGFCKIQYDMDKAEVDCYSFSGHKIGFFKGFGGLVYKKKIENILKDNPLIVGGDQQRGLRSGTENPTFVYLLSQLVHKQIEVLDANYNKAAIIKNALYKQIIDIAYNYGILVQKVTHMTASPYILSVTLRGIEGESLVSTLGDKIAISTGSACNSAILSGSDTIRAYYKNESKVDMLTNCTVRLSFDHTLTIDQIVDFFRPNFEEAVRLLSRASTAINMGGTE